MEDLASLTLNSLTANESDFCSTTAISPNSQLQQIGGTSPQNTAQLLSLDTIGNTQSTGSAITLSQTATTYQEAIGGGDTWDFYRFSLGTQAIVNFSMTGLSQAAYLYLYDSSNRIITYDLSSGTSDKSIVRELAAGTYYLGVGSTATVETSYALTGRLDALSGSWSTLSGYGLINAAAAVARATNSTPFSEVSNLGGTRWFADMVNAPEVWARGYTGQGVTVAVVDTGIDTAHAAFAGQIWTNSREIAGNGIDDDRNGYTDDVNGWDFVQNDSAPQDGNGHGTHVAGIIDQIAPSVRLMAVRVLDNYGNGSYANIARGIRYAADNGANIINLSLGGTSSDSTLQSAIAYAYGRGVEVCMAAGNSGGASPLYPAAYATQYGIAVGAVDSNRNLASFSNRSGTTVMDYVVAPGVNIYSTLPNNTWGYKSGTSMASPIVAGTVALLRSANPSLTPVQIEALLTGTTRQLGLTAPTSTLSSSSTTTASIRALDDSQQHLPSAQPLLPMPIQLGQPAFSGISTQPLFSSRFQLSAAQFEQCNRDRDESEVLDPLTRQLKERSQPRRNRLA